jgi:hypothetical protein
MARLSKYVKLHKDVLLEYVYDDNNLISEPYHILVNSKDRSLSYIASESSITGNVLQNQLFEIDRIGQKYTKINTSYYSFLQLKDYASGNPIKHDTIKLHIPVNWTFGEYLGFYLRVYAFDTQNQITYELSKFFFDMTDVTQQYLMDFTNPPLLFQEKLWGKNITINIPSLNEVSSQRDGKNPKEDSLNYNLTDGNGLSISSPIFIDFHFIENIKTLNNVKSYTLNNKVTTTFPQSPEYEKLGLVIEHSKNGDFFEIYGTYNSSIAGFNNFISESKSIGHRYYVQYNITMYEQNIRGKTLTFTQHSSFNESIEYRPIIKYSTTTAIIDVEMRLIDMVDESYIIRRASYGMLQDEVSKYAINLTKINLGNANKPKIYNIKSNIDPSLVGVANSMGRISNVPKHRAASGRVSTNERVKIETVKVPFPVLVDKLNIVGKSDNTEFDNTLFYGIGKMSILLYPFDNIFSITVASGNENSHEYLNLSGYGDIKLVFKSDSQNFDFPLYSETNMIDLSIGQLSFKVTENKYADIKRLYESGVNVFYITAEINSIRSVVYSGLFKIYDTLSNVADMNNNVNARPAIIRDPSLPKETAVITRKLVKEESVLKPKFPSEIMSNTITKQVSNKLLDIKKSK